MDCGAGFHEEVPSCSIILHLWFYSYNTTTPKINPLHIIPMGYVNWLAALSPQSLPLMVRACGSLVTRRRLCFLVV
jgi:hypothetical protein